MSQKELEKMTKASLLKLAKSQKLKATTRMTKAELIGVLTKELRGQKRRVSVSKAAKKAVKSKGAKTKKTPAKKSAKPKRPTPKKAARKKGPAKKIPVKAVKGAAVKKAAAAKKDTKQAPAEKKAVKRVPAARGRRIEAQTIRQKAEVGKYYLGAEEKYMPPLEAVDIPHGYGIDRIVAMVRDPYWIFTYWEVTEKSYKKLENVFNDEWPHCKTILRVYDMTEKSASHFDIEITGGANNWYIGVSPERRFKVSIGVLGPGGRFEEIATSNVVETPRSSISEAIDDRWMVPDDVFEQIFAASGGYDIHSGSEEFRKLLERHLLGEVGSGGVSSLGSQRKRKDKGKKK